MNVSEIIQKKIIKKEISGKNIFFNFISSIKFFKKLAGLYAHKLSVMVNIKYIT